MLVITTIAERPNGKIPTTNVTNELARALQAVSPVIHGGQVVTPWAPREVFGVITVAGPRGASQNPDYTDERYWVRLSHIDGTDSETSEQATGITHITTSYDADEYSTDAPLPPIITATNLAELNLDKEESGIAAYESGTHLLPKGKHVVVRCAIDLAEQPNARYYFYHMPQIRVMVSVNADGGGKYIGNFVKETVAVAPTAEGNVALADFGTLGPECYIFNAAEKGMSTHALTDPSAAVSGLVFPGYLLSRKAEDGRPVVGINGHAVEICAEPGSDALVTAFQF